MELTYVAALLAGLVSFLSPCVLPLVPGFIGVITGMGESRSSRTITNALLFVGGFSVLFIALGASAGVVGRFLSAHRDLVNRVAGACIVFFGLMLVGVVRIRVLSRDVRYHGPVGGGSWRPLLLGLAFALGWTPCAGPALIAMLLMAATGNSIWHGTTMLAAYSVGFGLPFVAVALGVNRFLSLYARWRHSLVWSERVGGVLLVAIGVLVFWNKLGDASFFLARILGPR